MTVAINSITIPTPMRTRGRYLYVPYTTLRTNGAGASVTAGAGKATWSFGSLILSDYTWWVTTLLAGAASLTAAATLWNDLDVETAFSSVTVRRPTYREFYGGRCHDVEIIIDTMIL